MGSCETKPQGLQHQIGLSTLLGTQMNCISETGYHKEVKNTIFSDWQFCGQKSLLDAIDWLNILLYQGLQRKQWAKAAADCGQ